MRAFYHVALHNGFTEAAKAVHVSQATLSLQVKALEKEFETQLFQRVGNRVQLTQDGQLLLELASPLVRGLDSIRDVFNERKGETGKGRVVLAASQTVTQYILPSIIKAYKTRFPRVDLLLMQRGGAEILSLLQRGEIDFGVIPEQAFPDTVEYTECCSSDAVLIVPRGHPLARMDRVTIEDVARYPFILKRPQREFSRFLAEGGSRYSGTLEVGDSEAVKKYVALGLGSAVIARICLRPEDEEEIEAIPANDLFGKWSYGVVLIRGRYLAAPARKLIEAIVEAPLQVATSL